MINAYHVSALVVLASTAAYFYAIRCIANFHRGYAAGFQDGRVDRASDRRDAESSYRRGVQDGRQEMCGVIWAQIREMFAGIESEERKEKEFDHE